MMTQNADKKREQIQMFCMDDLVPQDHLLRLIDQAIDWSFIYDLVIDKYSADNGRPSMDPVMLIKIPFIQYLYGIRSMRQTGKCAVQLFFTLIPDTISQMPLRRIIRNLSPPCSTKGTKPKTNSRSSAPVHNLLISQAVTIRISSFMPCAAVRDR